MSEDSLSRRRFLKVGAMGLTSLATIPVLNRLAPGHGKAQGRAQAQVSNLEGAPAPGLAAPPIMPNHVGKVQQAAHTNHNQSTVGDVNTDLFDPMRFLTDFDYGTVSQLPNGQTLREWSVVAS